MHPDSTPSALQVRDLTVSYGTEPAVDRVSFSLDPGSWTGLVGPNGAGKTSLLLSVSGQFKPHGGRVRFGDLDVYDHNLAYKRLIGYVHEEPFLYPFLTTEEFLWFVAGVKMIGRPEAGLPIASLMDAFGLETHRQRLTAHLSMGMRKKLAVAAALLGSPQILFLDEALGGLDVESVHRMKTLLRDFVGRGGTVLLSSHNLDFLEKICDRYLVLQKGRLIADFQRGEWEKHGSSKDLESHVLDLLGHPEAASSGARSGP